MAQAAVAGRGGGGGRVVGDYLVGRQIGSGSFSVVWHARHRVHGTEVAIKEIAMGRLNKKLQDSLMSEIFILKRINHPNIIHLHDIVEVPGKVYLVLEFCKGGDLSMYIQRHGSVSEATAKYFMQQLATGLQVLRDNNLIHRDLKPQNLLLSTDDDNAVLKIADFGFARSLQPRGLAETLCGSPLYMAPEIMQLQKYDAKADLWSVGAILFQLVTATTPFTGNSQIQLLQNIMRCTELHFPADNRDLSADCKDLCQKLLRRNPVERLTFEEFFNHPFLSERRSDDSLSSRLGSRTDGFHSSESSPSRKMEGSSQEDCLPFLLDDDSSGPEGSPSYFKRPSSMKSSYGFNVDTKCDRREIASSPLKNTGLTSRYIRAGQKVENISSRLENCKTPDRNLPVDSYEFNVDTKGDRRELASSPLKNTDLTSRYDRDGQKVENISSRLENHKMQVRNQNEPPPLVDTRSVTARVRAGNSLELIDQDYVLVSGSLIDPSSSSASTAKPSFPFKFGSPPLASINKNIASTAPMPIVGTRSNNIDWFGSLESQNSAPGTSHGSLDLGDAFEQSSTNSMTRIRSLQKCAAAIAELVHERIEAGKQLEAFSIQLVILAICKQGLHICHTQAVSGMEGSPSQESTRFRRNTILRQGTQYAEGNTDVNNDGSEDISSQIEKDFLSEVERAEELAKVIESGSTEMPDAMETIFQAALALGRHGGVEELMGEMENASTLYSKAVRLLVFLLVEAPALILNPPLSLTNSDRYRLRTYIDIISNRQKHLRSQRTAPLKCKDQP